MPTAPASDRFHVGVLPIAIHSRGDEAAGWVEVEPSFEPPLADVLLA
jgi:hypothetical protein